MFRLPLSRRPLAHRAVPGLPRLTRSRAERLFADAHSARGISLLADQTGAATAEYAIATMAAVAFAGLLVVIMRGDEVRGILTDLIRRALTVA